MKKRLEDEYEFQKLTQHVDWLEEWQKDVARRLIIDGCLPIEKAVMDIGIGLKDINKSLTFDTWDNKQIGIDKKIKKIDEDMANNQAFLSFKFNEIEKDIKYIMEHLGVKRGLTIDKKD
jgi:hypothetical protein